MQYFILRKTKFSDRVEYDTDHKARKGFKTFNEVIEKKIALETLNDDDHIEFVIVNDGHTQWVIFTLLTLQRNIQSL